MPSLGSCPACHQGKIIESERAYGCDHWKRVDGDCHFTIWKTVAEHAITADEVKALIAGETIGPFGLTSKAGKPFEASLHIDDKKTGHVAFAFAPRDASAPPSLSPVLATGDDLTDDLPF